jgi:membrane dipeptidase
VSDTLAQASDLLRRHPLVDGHNDLPWHLRGLDGIENALTVRDISGPVPDAHTDLPRLRRGGLGGQFWSVYVPASFEGDSAVTAVLEQVDLVHRLIAHYPQDLEFATTASDVRRIFASGKIASLIGAEGGHAIASSLGVLRGLYALGVRYMTLTHNSNVPWADSATDEPALGGLNDFGREVVREMQRLGMLVDLSHVSADTMNDVLDVAEAPVIFSHSSARGLCSAPRNVPDDVLARLARNGGVCMVSFPSMFISQEAADWIEGLKRAATERGLDSRMISQVLSVEAEYRAQHPKPAANLAQVADHIEHVREVAGVEHIGIGGDYDGTEYLPRGLEDVGCYPALFAELLGRGWSESDCAALAGENVLRALQGAEDYAKRS